MMVKLIYVADPMCSWCYGFGPELSGLLAALPGVPLEIVVGGLRAYNTQPMDDSLKTALQTHWRHVAQATGLPFSDKGLSCSGFIYDTEPACRAVVAARKLAADLPGTVPLQVFHAIQRAFYAEGQDVTRAEVLAEVASAALTLAGLGVDAQDFRRIWESAEIREETRQDFMQIQRWGISGFPALVLEKNDELMLVAAGYTPLEMLKERVLSIAKPQG